MCIIIDIPPIRFLGNFPWRLTDLTIYVASMYGAMVCTASAVAAFVSDQRTDGLLLTTVASADSTATIIRSQSCWDERCQFTLHVAVSGEGQTFHELLSTSRRAIPRVASGGVGNKILEARRRYCCYACDIFDTLTISRGVSVREGRQHCAEQQSCDHCNFPSPYSFACVCGHMKDDRSCNCNRLLRCACECDLERHYMRPQHPVTYAWRRAASSSVTILQTIFPALKIRDVYVR